MAMTERVWLHNPETGGNFHCPADAAAGWRLRGWVDGEEPQEINPAVAEWVGHAPAPEPAEPKTKKARADAAASTEGVNDVG